MWSEDLTLRIGEDEIKFDLNQMMKGLVDDLYGVEAFEPQMTWGGSRSQHPFLQERIGN